MQVMHAMFGTDLRELTLPAASDCVIPGVYWGAFDELLTPAYWRGQAWQHEALGTYKDLRLGRTLSEEVAACLLGGFGMPAELGLAAYARLRERDLLVGRPSACVLESALAEPFTYSGGRRTYRFPKQKARYLSACLARLDNFDEPADDISFRDLLSTFPGIGLKTASWIVRNYRASDAVAIIDVHILRAGRHIGLFAADWLPHRHYRRLETAFLCFANAISTRASLLDALMWDQMRRILSLTHMHRGVQSDPVAEDLLQTKTTFENPRAENSHASADLTWCTRTATAFFRSDRLSSTAWRILHHAAAATFGFCRSR